MTVNFEQDAVTNLDQTDLKTISELLHQQLKMESIEDNMLETTSLLIMFALGCIAGYAMSQVFVEKRQRKINGKARRLSKIN